MCLLRRGIHLMEKMHLHGRHQLPTMRIFCLGSPHDWPRIGIFFQLSSAAILQLPPGKTLHLQWFLGLLILWVYKSLLWQFQCALIFLGGPFSMQVLCVSSLAVLHPASATATLSQCFFPCKGLHSNCPA